MSALTGVGPSMASGNQTNSGSCALLPVAPTNRHSAITVSVPPQAHSTGMCAAFSITVRKSRVPKVVKIRKMPSAKPASPTRFTMKAFMPALLALCFSNQKPIRRYEQSPTPSHPTNSTA